MAKKKAAAASKSKKLAGQTVAFVGKFGYGKSDLEMMQKLAAKEGAKVVEADKTVPDYLVAGEGVGGNPPAAIAKLQKKQPQLQPIDQAAFYQLVNPTPEEFLALMLSETRTTSLGTGSSDRCRLPPVSLDLSG